MPRTIDTCATVGSLLLATDDLPGAAAALQHYLSDPEPSKGSLLKRLGVDVRLARDLASVMPRDPAELAKACELGTAWALGRRSVAPFSDWEPVVTSGDITDQGIDRMTAETLIGLIVGARRSVRLFSAYVDRGGLDVVTVSLAAATRRGVFVTVGYAITGDRHAAATGFLEYLNQAGDATRFRLVAIGPERPFPHAKLLTADGTRAYIGSANLTWPALTSNVEFGALVSGDRVATLERCFDALVDPPADSQGGSDGH